MYIFQGEIGDGTERGILPPTAPTYPGQKYAEVSNSPRAMHVSTIRCRKLPPATSGFMSCKNIC